MNVRGAVVGGFAGTTILTTLMRGSQAVGVSRVDFPFILGTMLTPDRDRAKVVGSLFHFVNGWLFALIYGALFRQLRLATWWLGAAMGAVHGLFVLLVLMSALPGMHPRMASVERGPDPTRQLEPPGFAGLNYGRGTPLVTLVAHVVYGGILGGLYRDE